MSRSPHLSSLVTLVLSAALAVGLTVGSAAPSSASVAPAVAAAPVASVEVVSTAVTLRTPALSPVLRRVLTLVNAVRATGYRCGGTWYRPVPALRLDARLNRAAGKFARKMGNRGFFSHTSPDGSGPGDRIRAEGYNWRKYGENIAAGQTGALAVVRAWLASAGHCKNLMGRFAEVGLGHAYVEDSPYGHYWVQDFATHR